MISPLPAKVGQTHPDVLKKINELVAAANAGGEVPDLTALTGRVTDTESALSGVEQEITGLTDTVTALTGRVTALEQGETTTPPLPPPPPPPDPEQPPPVIEPPTDTPSALLGPLPASLSTVAAMGGRFADYARLWPEWAEKRWAGDGAQWDNNNADYYDRAKQFYALGRLTGDAKWTDRANQMAVNYREKYLKGNSDPAQWYNASSYWAMLTGVAAHYAVTGDTASRDAVGYAALWLSQTFGYTRLGQNGSGMETRWRGRMLETVVLAHHVNAPMGGPAKGQVLPCPGATWAEKAGNILGQCFLAQSPDGAWRDEQGCFGAKPFMDLILCEAMILYYRLVGPDERIVPSVKRTLDYLFAKTWDGASQGFHYYEVDCSRPEGSGSRTPAPDLDLMFPAAYAWVYQQTRDTSYREKADLIFNAGMGRYAAGKHFWTSGKHFNQAFVYSPLLFARRG